jgi:ubiquinone/menaquinone biosynthesis C-methylase UbiE
MSICFDDAAEFYDQTRGYPPHIQEQIGQAILKAAGATPSSRILEMGIGTGRIAWPIIRAGYSYTGIDLSDRMMDRLRAKLATLPRASERVTLVQGDVTNMPFADGSFDIVLAVHVYHLVSDRRRAIAESVRVLKRPGVALNCHEETVNDPYDELDTVWCETLRQLGWPMRSLQERRAAQSALQEWQELGGTVDTIIDVEGQTLSTVADFLDHLEHRYGSSTWSIPDDIYTEALSRLRTWATRHYGPTISTPIPQHHRFVIERARFT